jgi:DNA-binding transcriptional ArsR family regulator
MARTDSNLDTFVHAIADPTRRRIICLLKEEKKPSVEQTTGLCAGDIEHRIKLAQPTVSHHMRILDKAGVVTVKRQGHWRRYQRNEKLIREMMKLLREQL